MASSTEGDEESNCNVFGYPFCPEKFSELPTLRHKPKVRRRSSAAEVARARAAVTAHLQGESKTLDKEGSSTSRSLSSWRNLSSRAFNTNSASPEEANASEESSQSKERKKINLNIFKLSVETKRKSNWFSKKPPSSGDLSGASCPDVTASSSRQTLLSSSSPSSSSLPPSTSTSPTPVARSDPAKGNAVSASAMTAFSALIKKDKPSPPFAESGVTAKFKKNKKKAQLKDEVGSSTSNQNGKAAQEDSERGSGPDSSEGLSEQRESFQELFGSPPPGSSSQHKHVASSLFGDSASSGAESDGGEEAGGDEDGESFCSSAVTPPAPPSAPPAPQMSVPRGVKNSPHKRTLSSSKYGLFQVSPASSTTTSPTSSPHSSPSAQRQLASLPPASSSAPSTPSRPSVAPPPPPPPPPPHSVPVQRPPPPPSFLPSSSLAANSYGAGSRVGRVSAATTDNIPIATGTSVVADTRPGHRRTVSAQSVSGGKAFTGLSTAFSSSSGESWQGRSRKEGRRGTFLPQTLEKPPPPPPTRPAKPPPPLSSSASSSPPLSSSSSSSAALASTPLVGSTWTSPSPSADGAVLDRGVSAQGSASPGYGDTGKERSLRKTSELPFSVPPPQAPRKFSQIHRKTSANVACSASTSSSSVVASTSVSVAAAVVSASAGGRVGVGCPQDGGSSPCATTRNSQGEKVPAGSVGHGTRTRNNSPPPPAVSPPPPPPAAAAAASGGDGGGGGRPHTTTSSSFVVSARSLPSVPPPAIPPPPPVPPPPTLSVPPPPPAAAASSSPASSPSPTTTTVTATTTTPAAASGRSASKVSTPVPPPSTPPPPLPTPPSASSTTASATWKRDTLSQPMTQGRRTSDEVDATTHHRAGGSADTTRSVSSSTVSLSAASTAPSKEEDKGVSQAWNAKTIYPSSSSSSLPFSPPPPPPEQSRPPPTRISTPKSAPVSEENLPPTLRSSLTKIKESGEKPGAQTKAKAPSSAEKIDNEGGDGTHHPYETLITEPYPEGIDATAREMYLSNEEFKAHLGMSREQFYALPKWKQQQKKRQAQLF